MKVDRSQPHIVIAAAEADLRDPTTVAQGQSQDELRPTSKFQSESSRLHLASMTTGTGVTDELHIFSFPFICSMQPLKPANR